MVLYPAKHRRAFSTGAGLVLSVWEPVPQDIELASMVPSLQVSQKRTIFQAFSALRSLRGGCVLGQPSKKASVCPAKNHW